MGYSLGGGLSCHYACERRRWKSHCRHRLRLFPSPPVGEGGRDAKHRGRVRGFSPRMQTPHPARTSSAPPSPTRGEGENKLPPAERGHHPVMDLVCAQKIQRGALQLPCAAL